MYSFYFSCQVCHCGVGCCYVLCWPLSVFAQTHFHVTDVAAGVTEFIHFDAENLAFCRNVLFENDPSLEFHYDLVYCHMIGRIVKFCKICPQNFKQVSYFP
jgi:hypothetical protein